MKIKVGVSNRHVHLNKESFIKLFGDIKLNNDFDLSQKGQFASDLFVTIKTDKDKIEKVRILGPLREYNQIEISRTDSYKLGLNPPIRESGDLENSEIVTIIGSKGEITTNGCIIATRHIHANKEKLAKIVKIKIDGLKGGILDNVSVKYDPSYTFELHLDTDDANAFGLKNGDGVEICEK